MLGVLWALILVFSAFDTCVSAAEHTIIVGTFSTEVLYTLKYDDKIRTLTMVARSAVSAASSWITLNHEKTKLYGTNWNTGEPTFVSYNVRKPYDIKLERVVSGGRICPGSKSIFVNAYQKEPYSVYGSYYYGDAQCSTIMSVHENGTLWEVILEHTYPPGSAIHGTAITPNGEFLLAADTTGNRIWTHKIDQITGLLTFVGVTNGPSEGAGPRHLAIHENGKYAYVVLEEASGVAQYCIHDDGTLSLVGDIYSLLRARQDPADYWADEVVLSLENRYLWATNRARNNSQKGYILAFDISLTGQISRQQFLLETSTSGGLANSVAASPFDDTLVALTDNWIGFVQIWHVDDGVVAHLDIPDGQGCCANAVWLD